VSCDHLASDFGMCVCGILMTPETDHSRHPSRDGPFGFVYRSLVTLELLSSGWL
jgi:hypothetical protein